MQKQRVNLFLDPEIVKKAKIEAIHLNMSLSALVEMALDKLKGLDKKK